MPGSAHSVLMSTYTQCYNEVAFLLTSGTQASFRKEPQVSPLAKDEAIPSFS
jgi:hypothetical protein